MLPSAKDALNAVDFTAQDHDAPILRWWPLREVRRFFVEHLSGPKNTSVNTNEQINSAILLNFSGGQNNSTYLRANDKSHFGILLSLLADSKC